MPKTKQTFSWPLLISPFIFQLGSSVYLFGLNWLLVKATGTTSLLGTIEGLGGFAFLVGDLLVGILVDNRNRKHVLVWTDSLSAAACLGGALLVNPQAPQTWVLIMVTMVLNLMLAVNYPAAKAVVPEVIALDATQRFNAFANTLFNFASILAPLVGGGLLAIRSITFEWFLAFNALSFILGAVMNATIHYDYTAPKESTPFLEGIISGLDYVRTHIDLLQLIIAMGVFNFFYAGLLLTQPYIAAHNFGGAATNYSLLLAVSATGGIIGGLALAAQKSQVSLRQVITELIIGSVALMGVGLALSFPVWLAGGALFGFIQSRFFVNVSTLIQNETQIDYLGRVFGLAFLAFDGLQPVGSFLFGFLIDVTRKWTYVIIGGCLVIAFSALNYWRYRHQKMTAK